MHRDESIAEVETLLMRENLIEFATRAAILVSLHTGEKMSTQDCLLGIEALWRELRASCVSISPGPEEENA